MSIFGKLKWFLKIHVLHNHSQRLLWLSQEAYIKKITNQYKINLNGRFLNTPMTETELLFTNHQSICLMLPSPDIRSKSLPKEATSTMLYQKKMGSVLYAATMTYPDIAFAVSQLAKFNQDLSQEYHQAADKIIQYLYGIKSKAICYGGDTKGNSKGRNISDKGQNNRKDSKNEAQLFICASNASFANNSINKKSLQKYIIKLFKGLII